MKRRTRILSIVLVMLLTIGLVPSSVIDAFAAEKKEIVNHDSYYYGEGYYEGDTLDLDDFLNNTYITLKMKDDGFTPFEFDTANNRLVNEDYSYNYTVPEYSEPLEGGEQSLLIIIDDGTETGYQCYLQFYVVLIEDIDYDAKNVTSIEITKEPDNPQYIKGYTYDYELFAGLEMLITFDDGITYDYSYDNECEYPAYGQYEVKIEEELDELPVGENTITFSYRGCTATQTITVSESSPATSIEITKAPKNTQYIKGITSIDELFAGLEMLIHFEDGTTYEYSYFEDGCYPETRGYIDIEEYLELDEFSAGENTITFTYTDYYGTCKAEQQINVLEEPVSITSMEITKAPDTTQFIEGHDISSYFLLLGLEMLITFEDGTTYEYSFEKDGYCPPLGYGDICVDNDIYDLPVGENTITYSYGYAKATQTITVVEDTFISNPVVGIEITKKPTKIFTEPFFSGPIEDVFSDLIEDELNYENENSVARNMAGAELAITREDGSVTTYTFNKFFYGSLHYYVYAMDAAYAIDVTDLGDYKAKVEFMDFSTEFTADHTSTEPTYLYGDVNMDGEISVLDATLIQKIGINLLTVDNTVMALADVNGDGRVSIIDVTYVQKYLVDLDYNTVKVGTPYSI